MTIADALTPNNITFTLGMLGILFTVYNSFRNPQISADKLIIGLTDRIAAVEKDNLDIKNNHLKSVENDIKALTISVNELSKTVVKLATIIDERIPRNQQG